MIPSYGAVVYTGNQTKFGQNKNKPILKLSVSDRMTSTFTVVVVILSSLYVQWSIIRIDSSNGHSVTIRLRVESKGRTLVFGEKLE